MKIKEILSQNKILPLATICSESEARNITTKLIEAQCPILEITLRDERVRSILHVFQEYSGFTAGLGTIRTIDDIDLAINNNFTFGITPGFSPNLCSYAQSKNFLIIPGIQSASEIMQASEMGYSILKFFPAELSGGAKKLKALQSVFPDISFIPTGGVNKNNLKSYLELENVICAGSSDFVSKDMLAAGEWEDIVLNIQNIKKDLI